MSDKTLDHLLSNPEPIVVGGVEIPIRNLTFAELKGLRARLADTGDDASDYFDITIDVVRMVVIQEITRDQAAQLFVLSGGDTGKLGTFCLRMVGLKLDSEKDPLPFE